MDREWPQDLSFWNSRRYEGHACLNYILNINEKSRSNVIVTASYCLHLSLLNLELEVNVIRFVNHPWNGMKAGVTIYDIQVSNEQVLHYRFEEVSMFMRWIWMKPMKLRHQLSMKTMYKDEENFLNSIQANCICIICIFAHNNRQRSPFLTGNLEFSQMLIWFIYISSKTFNLHMQYL